MAKHKRGRSREQEYMQNPMFNPNMMHPNMMHPNMNMGHNPNMSPNMGGNMNPNMGGNMDPNMGGMNPNMGGNMNPNMGGNMGPNMGGMGNQSGNPLLNMLNGVDINQLSSLLGAFGKGNSSKKQYDEEDNKEEFTRGFGGETPIANDDIIHFLGAVKPFLPPNKVKVMDKIIDMYMSGELED